MRTRFPWVKPCFALPITLFSLIGTLEARAQCDQWSTIQTGPSGMRPGITCATMWNNDSDESTSPQLAVGAYFRPGNGSSFAGVGILGVSGLVVLGGAMNNGINAISTWDPDSGGPIPEQLIAGGRFTAIDGMPALRVARWDGVAWNALGSGIDDGEVLAVAAWDPDADGPIHAELFAAGSFFASGDTEVRSIARWGGEAWHPVAGGFWGASPSTVFALTIWDPDGPGSAAPQLVAGGTFRRTGPHFVNEIARWDGVSWHSFGNGPFESFGWVGALGTWDPDGAGPATEWLIAGQLRDVAHPIRAWDGTEWRDLGEGISGDVFALTSWKPGASNELPTQLFAAGRLAVETSEGYVSTNATRWGGADWSSFDVEQLWGVQAFQVSVLGGTEAQEFELLALGYGIPTEERSESIAAWSACSSTRCPGDADGDLDVDIGDIAVLIQHWEDMHPSVPPGSFGDLTRNGRVNIEDLAILLPQWGELCR